MDAIMLSVINMSLTASIVILGVCMARLLLLKGAPKIISYILWIVVAFRLIVPISFESNFSLMPTKADPIPQNIVYQEDPRIDTGITGVDNFVSDMLPNPAQNMNDGYIYSDANIVTSNPLQTYFSVAALIWIIGIICMLVYSLISIYLLKRRVSGATLLQDNIFETKNIKTPFVIGFIRPKIYLPTGLSAKEKEYIILHEQTHISRFDHIVKLIAFFILCVHWFNPLVWVAFILMSADMELSCDEKVLQKLGDDIKKDYSYSLLSLSTGRRIINGSPLAFGEGGIKARIKNILKFKKSSRVVLIAGAVIVAVLITGFAANRAGESPQYLFNLYQNAANEVNYSNNRSYELHRIETTSEPGIMNNESLRYYEVNWALSKNYRYFRTLDYTDPNMTSSSSSYYIDGVWYGKIEGLVDGENVIDKIAFSEDPANWNPQTIMPIEEDSFENATVDKIGDNTRLQLTVRGLTVAKHIWGIFADSVQYDNEATVTTVIDKGGHIIEQQIEWSYMAFPVESDIPTNSTKVFIKGIIRDISIEDFEIDFPDDLASYEMMDSTVQGQSSLISDLQNIDYDASRTIDALQKYVKNEIGRNYSQDIIARRVLCSYLSEKGPLYLLIQLPNISEGHVIPGVDFTRIVAVEKNNENEYSATTISLGAVVEPIDGPYVQFSIPLLNEGLSFVVTHVVDYEYIVFFNGEQLALNDDGMVAVVIASDTEPTIEQWPVVSRTDTYPEYPRNASGQTYGDGNHVQQIGPPDLIAVQGQDGTEGYVYYAEMIGEEATSPEEALEWMADENYRNPRAINIYESDGKTKIGEFILGNTTEYTY